MQVISIVLFSTILCLCFQIIAPTSTFRCRECDFVINNLYSTGSIQADTSGCSVTNTQHSSCSQSLHVHYAEKKATILFEAGSDDVLILSNAAQIITNTTMIWFDDDDVKLNRQFQITYLNDNNCTTDTINNIYNEVRNFKYTNLWAPLVTSLYSSSTKPADLTCADNQDKPIKCPYGFCQLVSPDRGTFFRSCVLNDSTYNRYGLILESKTISKVESQSSVRYTCNIPMCNTITTAKSVQDLLGEKGISPSTTTTTTTTTTTATTSRPTTTSGGNMNKSMINFESSLILLTLFLFFY